jgi:(1->4)-alpha-D-glucan 1-alpha-D-glucosylmutase
MAKGVEDTTFYLYNRLISLNEVGGEPDRFGITPDEFHAFNLERAERWPASMSASSTHDTKRSEDVRARINILSEIPDIWEEHVFRWAEINRGHKLSDGGDGLVPDENDEYLLYQTLVGAWPYGEVNDQVHQDLVARVQAYMEKATREAKLNTSWINPMPPTTRASRSSSPPSCAAATTRSWRTSSASTRRSRGWGWSTRSPRRW